MGDGGVITPAISHASHVEMRLRNDERCAHVVGLLEIFYTIFATDAFLLLGDDLRYGGLRVGPQRWGAHPLQRARLGSVLLGRVPIAHAPPRRFDACSPLPAQ